MNKTLNTKKEKAQKELESFIENFQSLILGTANQEGKPFSSYAPFVEDEEHNFYINVSGLVEHSRNINENKNVSIMFIEDECKAMHPFGRKRLYYSAKAEKFETSSKIDKLFVEKFGEKINHILNMPDFQTYKISPIEGSLVLGFGAAYKVDKNKKILGQKVNSHNTKHETNMQK